ncbi:sodium-dependent noradrenaline transporter-like [Tubulanus polymorphus]|uniref:sodium-dependent noradrenaline transporter-like n=1 Tax=Tubulanus polymorphus TaxID=672921 RepID=UPI003DA51F0A
MEVDHKTQIYPMLPRNNGENDDETALEKVDGEIVDTGGDETAVDVVGDEDAGARLTWGTRFDFLLSTIGFAVDLANVWRFPYLCYKNGGGAFLIPYFSMMLFGALPLFYMELILGQYHREGVISLWKIGPIFKGIGWCACLISLYVSFYYNVVISWSMQYLFASFTLNKLPWTSCGNWWNTPYCWDAYAPDIHQNVSANGTINSTLPYNQTTQHIHLNSTFGVSPAAEYFERSVLSLHLSEGIHDLGTPKWQLAGCTLLVFILLYFSLFKGVKSMGKAVWVTATMPYVVLLILLVRGVLLEGAKEGILYFITPKIDRLGDASVWIDAAVQIFYSVGAGFGVHIAYSSYNNFNNNCYRDCLCACVVNSFTSIFSGFVIFSYLGFMAQSKGVSIDNVVADGPGLVFIVYPEAIATLPGSQVWSVIFFIMLLTLGLDSSFGGLEAILTAIRDEFKPQFAKLKYSRELATFVLCVISFMFSLINVTYGGVYVVTLMDTYAAGTSILFVSLTQCIAVSWVYGLHNFCNDAKTMLGFVPGIYWRVCWKIISPVFILVIVIYSFSSHTPLVYAKGTGKYLYPSWANGVGWFITLSSIILLPSFAVFIAVKMKATNGKQRLALCISPTSDHDSIRQGKPIKRFNYRHWITI